MDRDVGARRASDLDAHRAAVLWGPADRAPGRRRCVRDRGASSLEGSLMFDYLVVGAGFAGSVLAERLANGSGKRVLLCDKRPHIGGNAYDHYNDDGVLVHKYGPHIFHTNSETVFDYLSRFTEWRPYQHRVLASVDGQLMPIPINLTTINQYFGLNLTAFDVEAFLAKLAEK